MNSKRNLSPAVPKEPKRPKGIKKLISDNLEYFGRFYTCMIIASGKRTIGERQELIIENLNEFLRGTCLSKYQ